MQDHAMPHSDHEVALLSTASCQGASLDQEGLPS